MGRKQIKTARPEQVLEITGYVVGAMPPFGRKTRLWAIVDPGIIAQAEIFGGGEINAMLRLTPEELLRVTEQKLSPSHNNMIMVLALIPAYNEAAHVADVVTGVCVHLPALVVDDGSTDGTAVCAERAGATVLRQVPNQGKGAALRAGFRWALDEGFDAVLTLDADGQHDPAEIPKFLRAYAARRADLIIGARDFSQMPPVRRLSNTVGRWAFSWAIGQPIRDNQSGYRLISRRLLEAVLIGGEPGFEFEVEMIVTCVRRGFRLDWAPIRTIYAGEGSHIHPWHHTVNFFRVVWQTRRSREQGVVSRRKQGAGRNRL